MSEKPASAASHPTRLTGAEIVWATLEGEGVRHVFGYPGGAILPVYDALRKYPDPPRPGPPRAGRRPHGRRLRARLRQGRRRHRHLRPRRHQPRHRHRHGHDGFGAAWSASPARSPPSSSAPTPSRRSTSPASPCPSPSTTTSSPAPQDIAPALREAFLIARSGRPGPVLVDITKDAQQGSADLRFRRRRALAAPPAPHALAPSHDAISEAIELILAAKRPVILAGHGIMESGAMDQVRTLAERLQIPVA